MTCRIALTPGEPAGIGPDLAILLAQESQEHEIVVFADPNLLQQRARQLGLPLTIRPFNSQQPPHPSAVGQLCVAPIKLVSECVPGTLDIKNAPYVIDSLNAAVASCVHQECGALVTGPIHKGNVNDSFKKQGSKDFFYGHTEYLAQLTNTKRVVMMLAAQKLRVALATTHIPLSQVAQAINKNDLKDTIQILHKSLQKDFGLANPTILVCGLNPHAGESGHLGREEIEIIEPVLNELRQEKIQLIGPLPADTLFTPKILAQGDAVLAMYHDQGLPVLKYQGFGRAVNITLGLPIIRTSVDHGTALDLAGTGKVSLGSLQQAVQWAANMVVARSHNKTKR